MDQETIVPVGIEVAARRSCCFEFHSLAKMLDYSFRHRLTTAPPGEPHHPSDDDFQSSPLHCQCHRVARSQHMPRGLFHPVRDQTLHRCKARHVESLFVASRDGEKRCKKTSKEYKLI